MCEILINQDQDTVIRFSPCVVMYTIPFLIDGKPYGINLMYGNKLLGSFDTLDEAIKVIDDILRCENRVFVVPGFSDYDGESDFWEIVNEIELKGWANV